MKALLAFKTIYVDSLFFPAGMTLHAGDTFRAYDANYPEEEEIITEKKKKEEELIKWFLHSQGKELLLDELNIGSNPFIDYSVTRPIIENTQEKLGDIDILICEAHRPEKAIAFQCKAVTVTAFNQDI